MSVAILVPSLNRSYRLQDVVTNIHAATTVPHKIYFCVGDDESKWVLDRLGEWYLDDSGDPDKRYVTRMNKLVNYLDDEETIFFGSDDVTHHMEWYEQARAVMDRGFDLIVVNDLHNERGTQALMRREYLSRAVFDAPGLAFHPGYIHNFADTEQFLTGYMNRTLSRAMNSIVEHLHPVFRMPNALPWDSTYNGALDGWDHDRQLYETRSMIIQHELASVRRR